MCDERDREDGFPNIKRAGGTALCDDHADEKRTKDERPVEVEKKGKAISFAPLSPCSPRDNVTAT